jgi:hypothetical protein
MYFDKLEDGLGIMEDYRSHVTYLLRTTGKEEETLR